MATGRAYPGVNLTPNMDPVVREALRTIDVYLKDFGSSITTLAGPAAPTGGLEDATYALLSLDALLPNARRLISATPITLNDGGVGGNLSITLNQTSALPAALAAVAAPGVSPLLAHDDHIHKFPTDLMTTGGDKLSLATVGAHEVLTINKADSDLLFTNALGATIFTVHGSVPIGSAFRGISTIKHLNIGSEFNAPQANAIMTLSVQYSLEDNLGTDAYALLCRQNVDRDMSGAHVQGIDVDVVVSNGFNTVAPAHVGQDIKLSGLSASPVITGAPDNCSGLAIEVNFTIPVGSAQWRDVHGIRVINNKINGVPSLRTYGILVGSGGNGSSYAMGVTSPSFHVAGTGKLNLGQTNQNMPINWLNCSTVLGTTLNMALNSVNAYKFSPTNLYPDGTIRTQSLGLATTKGWQFLYLQDTAASFTTAIQATSTGVGADRIFTLNLSDGNRTLTLTGDSIINQNVSSIGAPQFARIGVGAAAHITELIQFADPANIVLGAGTGTKIGTATTQKLGFFNAAPVVQRVDAGVLTDSTGGAVDGTLADVGIVFTQATLNNNFADLADKYAKVRTALRDLGLMA